MRALPPELDAALRRARSLEAVALADGGADAHQRAIRGTSALVLAAVDLGWQIGEVAAALGLPRQTVSKRLGEARQKYGENLPALVFDAPLDKPPHPRAMLNSPADEREWLTREEAAALVGVHPFTIRNWSRAALLPHTDRTYRPHLFLRADLIKLQRCPRYKARGIDYAKARNGLW